MFNMRRSLFFIGLAVLQVTAISCRKTNRTVSTSKDLFTSASEADKKIYYWTYIGGEKKDVICDARCRDGFNPISNPPPSVESRISHYKDQLRAVSVNAATIPAQIDKYIRNPNEVGGSHSANIRAQVESIFSSSSGARKDEASNQVQDDIVDLNQPSNEIIDLGNNLVSACATPASNGLVAEASKPAKATSPQPDISTEQPYTMSSRVWLDVYTNYNIHLSGHKVHSYELRQYGGQNDDGSPRWVGLAPKTQYYEVIVIGHDRSEFTAPDSGVSFKRKDLVEVVDPSINKTLYVGTIVGITGSHAIIQLPQSQVEAAGKTNVDEKSQIAISWTSTSRKIRKSSLKSLDATAQEAITGTCVLSCEYSHENFFSGNHFYVWKKVDLCSPGFKCGANNLGIVENEHCAKEYRHVRHNVLPRKLGCFQ